jgi:hypothetical protein
MLVWHEKRVLVESVAYQAAADKQHGDGHVLQVGGAPAAAPAAEVFEEDVGRPIKEDEGALDELGRGTPFLARPLGADVPGLVYKSVFSPFCWCNIQFRGNKPIRDRQSYPPSGRE